MNTRMFALVVGIIYLVLGVAGFIPGLVEYREHPDLLVDAGEGVLFGLPVNVLHHIVHLLVGALGVLAYRTFDASRTFARGLAILYGLLAVMGLIDAANLNTTFGLVPIFDGAVWLHAVTAIVATYFGWGPVPARSEAASA